MRRKARFISPVFENVATGLRVGTVVCPSRYRPEIERAIRATTWNTLRW